MEKNISVRRKSLCRHCRGTGAKDAKFKHCPVCRGEGHMIKNVRTQFGMMRMQTQCSKCGGQGKFAASVCTHCHGHKTVSESKNFTVKVNRGIENGKQIVFEGEGDVVETALPGDVIFKVNVKKDKNFRRDGNDLHTKLQITFKEAILGFEKEI